MCMEFVAHQKRALILRYLLCVKSVHWAGNILELNLTLHSLCVSVLQDDEYVVYNTDQIRLKYVVQYILTEDEVKDFQPSVNMTPAPQYIASSSDLCECI